MRVLLGLVHAIPFLSNEAAISICHSICGIGFRLCLGLSPWIKIRWVAPKAGGKAKTLSQVVRDVKKSSKDEGGKGTLLLMNHSSFIDSLVASAVVAAEPVGQFRFLMTESLFHVPVWGDMCKMLGHFPVYALVNKKGSIANPLGSTANDEDHENFKIDKLKQQKTSQDIDRYVQKDEGLVIYPEGTISRQIRRGQQVTQLLPFRFGGFNIGVKHRMNAVAIIAQGCEIVWPWGSKIGGLPGEINLVAVPLESLFEDESKGKGENPNVVASVKAHDIMESETVALHEKTYAKKKEPLSAPVCILLGTLLFALWATIILPLIGALIAVCCLVAVLHLFLIPVGMVAQKKNKID